MFESDIVPDNFCARFITLLVQNFFNSLYDVNNYRPVSINSVLAKTESLWFLVIFS